MTLHELHTRFQQRLSALYATEEINTFFAWLTEAYLGWNRFEASLHKQDQLAAPRQLQFTEALDRLEQSEPIQYILGETEWLDMTLVVNRHTLIPRPETEHLVRWITDAASDTPKHILDIGTGSGCLAIALAKEWPSARVEAIDISSEALAVATTNAAKQGVDITFSEADILSVKKLPHTYDLIVSNPPYVRRSEQTQMHPNVLKFEPKHALYVDDETPFLFYTKIARLAQHHLKPGGKLYFEINEYLGDKLVENLEEIGFSEITLGKDQYEKDRMICCIR